MLGEVMVLLNETEFERWFRQAEQTLRSAEHDAVGGFWNWACFKAEQAAQFAVKGLLRALGEPAFGHALTQLLAHLTCIGISVPQHLHQAGRELEREYIPTRYADSYPSGSPYEFYDAMRAQQALALSRQILDFVWEVFRHARNAGATEGPATGAD